MTCYVIVDSTPTNPEQLIQYSQKAAPTVAKYQGKFLVKGEIEVLHGDKPYLRKAVIQFPDKQSALNWYHSREYQDLAELREKGMDSQFHIVEAIA